jgi:hypothetical protein
MAKSSGRILCSLTTVPSRLRSVWNVLRSALTQTVMPDLVVLNIPRTPAYDEGEVGRLQGQIACHKERARVVINRTDEDHGPIMKIAPTVALLGDNDWVLIIDDDRVLHPNCLEYFLTKQQSQYPFACLSSSGWIRSPSHVTAYQRFVGRGTPTDLEVDWVEGTNGIFCSAQHLKKVVSWTAWADEFADRPDLHKLLKRNDDHWISYLMHKHGVPLIRVGGELWFPLFYDMPFAQTQALSGTSLKTRAKFHMGIELLSRELANRGIYRLRSRSLRASYGIRFFSVLYTVLLAVLLLIAILLFMSVTTTTQNSQSVSGERPPPVTAGDRA